MEDHSEVAVENSVNFEAVKTSMSQSKTGTILRLAIHPNDVPASLHTDWVGTRYMVVMVPLNDDETPKVNERDEHVRAAIRSAGMLCRNTDFQVFMGTASEEDCITALRTDLGILSRAELKINEQALKRFEEIREAFADTKGGI